MHIRSCSGIFLWKLNQGRSLSIRVRGDDGGARSELLLQQKNTKIHLSNSFRLLSCPTTCAFLDRSLQFRVPSLFRHCEVHSDVQGYRWLQRLFDCGHHRHIRRDNRSTLCDGMGSDETLRIAWSNDWIKDTSICKKHGLWIWNDEFGKCGQRCAHRR